MPEAWVAGLSLVMSGIVSGLFAWLIKRGADRSQASSSRDQIEAAAFKRAESIYVNALDRSQKENEGLAAKVSTLETRHQVLETELETEREERRAAIRAAHAEITGLRLERADQLATIRQLKRILAQRERFTEDQITRLLSDEPPETDPPP